MLDRLRVVFLAIGVHALLQARVIALVAALPHPTRVVCLRRLGRACPCRACLRLCRHGRQRQHDHQREQCCHAGTATEQRQGQQQHQWQQPETAITPAGDFFATRCGTTFGLRIEHAERAQVGIIDGQGLVATTAAAGQPLQACGIQPGLAQAGAGIERAALRRAQAQSRYPITGQMHLRSGVYRSRIGMVGNQQDVALGEPGLLQQVARPCDRAIRALAVFGHHVRTQRIQEQGDIGGVFGQWRDRVGIPCIRDQCNLAASTFAQQGREFCPCLWQSRRRQVAGQDTTGEIQRHHQRRLALPQRLLVLLPGRPRHRQHCSRRGEQARPSRPRTT